MASSVNSHRLYNSRLDWYACYKSYTGTQSSAFSSVAVAVIVSNISPFFKGPSPSVQVSQSLVVVHALQFLKQSSIFTACIEAGVAMI